MGREILAAIIFALLVAFIVDLIFAAPLMLLWNALIPTIFGLGKITFWQAFGLEILVGILFNPTSPKVKSKD